MEKQLESYTNNIENIDIALFEWVNETVDVHSYTQEGWKKVPIVWLSAERAFQLKADKDIRDSSGMVKLPIITIDRTSINKDPTKRGAFPANLLPVNDEKGGVVEVSRRINQDKSNNFTTATVARSRFSLRDPRAIKKTVYQTSSIPVPIHLSVTYSLNIKTEFMQQMNQIIQPFFTVTNNSRHFVFTSKDKHKIEGFIKGDFGTTSNANNLSEERKLYTSKIEIEVLGRIIGAAENQVTPRLAVRENAVEVKITGERTIFNNNNE